MERPDPQAQQRRVLARMKFALIVLVAASTGLMSLYAEATIFQTGLATGAGIAVGVILVWVAFPSIDDTSSSRSRTRR